MDSRSTLRVTLLGFTLMTAAALWATGLGIRTGDATAGLVTGVAGLIGAHFYRPGRSIYLNRIVTSIEATSLLTLVGAIGGAASYAAAAISTGYVDAFLAGADTALGFDWLAYWRLTHSSPGVEFILNAGYNSILAYPAILVMALALSGNGERAYRFIMAFAIALMLTDLVFIFAPAESAALHYFGPDAPIIPAWGKEHFRIINELRAGDFRTIPLDHLVGLITFPSFHAASAILFIWGSWTRTWLKILAIMINGTMLISTPVIGSHYLIDVIGGILVAMVGITVVEATFRQRERQPAAGAKTLSFT